MNAPEGFAPLATAAVRGLVTTRMFNFDVYLPADDGQGAVLYQGQGAASRTRKAAPGRAGAAGQQAGAGDAVSAGSARSIDFDRLRDHGVSYVFVRAEDLMGCEKALESSLQGLLANPEFTSRERADIVHSVGTMAAQSIINSAFTPDDFERTVSVTDGIVDGVMHDPMIARYVINMASHERSTASHMQVVSTLATILGMEVFGQDVDMLKSLALSGMLHDLGKLSVPPEILHKVDALTEQEVRIIQQHPIESVRLIGANDEVPPLVRQAILQHHERIDGRGYPLGIKGDDILPMSRVLTITDSFHAMIGPRTYRASLSVEDANRVMRGQAGRQFDEQILERWIALCEQHAAARVKVLPAGAASADDHAARNEHRPVTARRFAVHQRRPRFVCENNAEVRCVYAGRLAHVTAAPEDFGASVHDVSHDGICIHSTFPMFRGEIVYVRIRVHEQFIWVKSMVAWCNQREAELYMVGLQFLSRAREEEVNQPATVAPLGGYAFAQHAAGPSEAAAQPAPFSKTESAAIERADALALLEQIRLDPNPSTEAEETAVELAASPDATIRHHALEALVRVDTPAARGALLAMLHDDDRDVRLSAIDAVADGALHEAITDLRMLLNDEDETVALSAAAALGMMNDWSGLPYVAGTLANEGPNLRLAVLAFNRITGEEFSADRAGIVAARQHWKRRQQDTVEQVEEVAPALA